MTRKAKVEEHRDLEIFKNCPLSYGIRSKSGITMVSDIPTMNVARRILLLLQASWMIPTSVLKSSVFSYAKLAVIGDETTICIPSAKASISREFVCPECGSWRWGTLDASMPNKVRYCKGSGRVGCRFRWTEDEDDKYMPVTIRIRPEDPGESA